MDKQEILDVLADLDGGEDLRITPDPCRIHTDRFQPQDPFETTVTWVETETEEKQPLRDPDTDSLQRWDVIKHDIHVESHPDDEDADEYQLHYSLYANGVEKGGGITYREDLDGSKYYTTGGVGSIEEIEVL